MPDLHTLRKRYRKRTIGEKQEERTDCPLAKTRDRLQAIDELRCRLAVVVPPDAYESHLRDILDSTDSCRPVGPNERCGGCGECLLMQARDSGWIIDEPTDDVILRLAPAYFSNPETKLLIKIARGLIDSRTSEG